MSVQKFGCSKDSMDRFLWALFTAALFESAMWVLLWWHRMLKRLIKTILWRIYSLVTTVGDCIFWKEYFQRINNCLWRKRTSFSTSTLLNPHNSINEILLAQYSDAAFELSLYWWLAGDCLFASNVFSGIMTCGWPHKFERLIKRGLDRCCYNDVRQRRFVYKESF